MSNVLVETKQQQVIALGRLGWSLRRIEGETGVRRETVSGYLKAAGVAVRGRGGWRRGRRQIRPPRARCPPTRWPPSRLRRQDLVDQHGFAGRYASVRRYVRRVRGGLTPEPSGIIKTGPCEEAQVDCGEGPMVRDPSRCLDSFDFTFTKKMNRALVFELGTEAGRADGRHAR